MEDLEELKKCLGLNLTPKQRAFCVHYIETMGNAPESAQRAYHPCTRESARAMACRNLKNPKILRFIRHLFMAEGMDGQALKVLREAMEAIKSGRGAKDVPDHRTRLQAAEFVLQHCPQAVLRAVMAERLADDDPAA